MRLQTLRYWIVALALSLPALGQHLAIKAPQETVGNPTSKPLKRRFVGVEPMTLYHLFMSSSLEERRQALHHLGHDVPDVDQPVDARLYALNLDSDADLEYVLIASGFPAATVSYVFDKDAQGWWLVGEFSYWWHWNANDAERFIELREVVSSGRKEIIVRERGGGTGVAETELSIYRMHNGYLYRVFHTMEDAYHYIYGAGRSEYEHRDIDYPDVDGNGAFLLLVRYKKRIEPDQHSRPVREIRCCSVFRWDAASFVFVEDKTAASKACSGELER